MFYMGVNTAITLSIQAYQSCKGTNLQILAKKLKNPEIQ